MDNVGEQIQSLSKLHVDSGFVGTRIDESFLDDTLEGYVVVRCQRLDDVIDSGGSVEMDLGEKDFFEIQWNTSGLDLKTQT